MRIGPPPRRRRLGPARTGDLRRVHSAAAVRFDAARARGEVTALGRRGELRLTAAGRRWRTRYRAPLFVNVLPCPGGGLLAAPVDQGGGLRNGERHLQRVALAEGAEVTWAPPASTLCLPGGPGVTAGPAGLGGSDAPGGRGEPEAPGDAASDAAISHLQLAARVGRGSYLRVAAPPLIPFSGAAVAQTTVVRIAAGGECLLVESGCPGRTQMGERWEFRRLAYRLTVLHDTRVVYRERWDLRPPAVPFAASGFGDCLGWGTCVACGPRAVAELADIRGRLEADGAAVSHGAITGEVAVARILDPHGYLVTRLAADVARVARDEAA